MDTIKLVPTEETTFVWQIITPEQAKIFMALELFNVYILHDDDSESMVETLEELIHYIKGGVELGIEVGHIKIGMDNGQIKLIPTTA
jgi:hypothetical protein